jgi:glutathionylspermidine synthase
MGRLRSVSRPARWCCGVNRHSAIPRPDLKKIIEEAGFAFAEEENGARYWDESAFYSFTLDEIETELEHPTNEIAALCLELVERAVVEEKLFASLCLPPRLQDLARESWKRGDGTLYGRFDLSYNGHEPAKLLEYNADTPTSLFEAAVFQWDWLEDKIDRGELPKSTDQFNSIHDCLVTQWRCVARDRVHFASLRDVEDEVTVRYLAHTARIAGLNPIILPIDEIGDTGVAFVDQALLPIKTLFKLYPWEWIVEDEFGLSRSFASTTFLEPAWKAILSTKAILPVLWNMAPGHPNLLPARFSEESPSPELGRSFVRKPYRSREGANVTVVEDCKIIEATPGTYGGRSIDQALAKLPDFDGNRPVVGSWIVGQKSCGIGIRESRSEVTTNRSRFVPHIIAAP